MSSLKLYESVKIRKLLKPSEQYNSWGDNERPPKIGDVGAVIDILKADNSPNHYLVEMPNPETGSNIWLCEFLFEEIEIVSERHN